MVVEIYPDIFDPSSARDYHVPIFSASWWLIG